MNVWTPHQGFCWFLDNRVLPTPSQIRSTAGQIYRTVNSDIRDIQDDAKFERCERYMDLARANQIPWDSVAQRLGQQSRSGNPAMLHGLFSHGGRLTVECSKCDHRVFHERYAPAGCVKCGAPHPA